MRRKSDKNDDPEQQALDPHVLEERRRAHAAALDDLTEAKAQLREAALRMAERERQLARREEELEAKARRLARKYETRRERQHPLDAFRGRFGEHEQKSTESDTAPIDLSALEAREAELDRFAEDLDAAQAQSAKAQAELQKRAEEIAQREEELGTREAAVAELEPREQAVTAKEEELDTRERRLKREAERQQQVAERLDRHAADLAERERALARLGQSLLERRGSGDAASTAVDDVEIAFSEGFAALSAAAKSIRRER